VRNSLVLNTEKGKKGAIFGYEEKGSVTTDRPKKGARNKKIVTTLYLRGKEILPLFGKRY